MRVNTVSRLAIASGTALLMGRLASSAASAAGGSRQLVLVVDDDRLVCESMIEMLDLEGFSGVAVNSGEEAVATYRERQGEIGLVLLDLSMPGMDGLETLQALRALNRDVQVVLVSGYDRNVALRHLGDYAAAGFLQKPFDFMKFVETVSGLL